ncbi:TRAP transporter large permease subunit [candidate division KSB3 bacterium]|uniref:TRAP transporter large permease subunit n=1 Tax=candidate division KSB3 bacterium TaxID=2044937 RepID=A0A9D5JTC0_9BACT|nr:TRAP transporter large permease subunit [candidate division KSB3 bacterium]MBD3323810.1 TRAP transporter large permease subunit [candidate division KSB3 bacterium]
MLLLIFIGLLLVLMSLGIMIAYALGLTSFVALVIGSGIEKFPFELIANRLYYGINSFPLLAVPMFILAGQIMNAAKLTDRIFDFVNKLVGHVRGGLGQVNVIASMIFAGMSGSATADAGGLGAVEIKAMNDAGYPADFSVGITGASSMVGPIIPPSIPMVVYGVLASVSVGELFLGGLIPGVMLGASLMVLCGYFGVKRNFPKQTRPQLAEIVKSFKKGFFALLTPLIIIGGIWSGVFTPTEAGATAVVYALFLGVLVYKEISLRELWHVFNQSARLSVRVIFILTFGAFYGWLLIRYRIPMVLSEYLATLSTNPVILLLVINLFFFVVGCFMSTIVSVTILTPIFVPIIKTFGINPLHFGVVMVFNLTLGNITPPFGIVLYTLSSVANMPVIQVVKALIPFLIPLLIALLLCVIFPPLVTYIPLHLM